MVLEAGDELQISVKQLTKPELVLPTTERQRGRREQYLSAGSVRCPDGHGQSFTVATDVVAVVQDAVFGTEEDSRPTERQVPAVYERKSADKQEKTFTDRCIETTTERS